MDHNDHDTHDVYLPLMVSVHAGEVVAAYIDWDGAPWMFTADEDSVWCQVGEEWIGTTEAEDEGDPEQVAADWLATRLRIDT